MLETSYDLSFQRNGQPLSHSMSPPPPKKIALVSRIGAKLSENSVEDLHIASLQQVPSSSGNARSLPEDSGLISFPGTSTCKGEAAYVFSLVLTAIRRWGKFSSGTQGKPQRT